MTRTWYLSVFGIGYWPVLLYTGLEPAKFKHFVILCHMDVLHRAFKNLDIDRIPPCVNAFPASAKHSTKQAFLSIASDSMNDSFVMRLFKSKSCLKYGLSVYGTCHLSCASPSPWLFVRCICPEQSCWWCQIIWAWRPSRIPHNILTQIFPCLFSDLYQVPMNLKAYPFCVSFKFPT